jgi:hypothetical protein
LLPRPKLAAPCLPTPSISPERFHPYTRRSPQSPSATAERVNRRRTRGSASVSPPTPGTKPAPKGNGRDSRSPSQGRLTLKFKDGRYVSPPPMPVPKPQAFTPHCRHGSSRLRITTSALELLTPEPETRQPYKAGRVLPVPQDRDTLSPEPNL